MNLLQGKAHLHFTIFLKVEVAVVKLVWRLLKYCNNCTKW